MVRILFCTDYLMAGGAERQLTELITRLDPQEFEIQVICLYAERWQRSLHFAPTLQAHGIPLHILNLGHGFSAKARGIVAIIRLTWKFRPHLIHAVNYHSNLLTRLARSFMPLSVKLLGTVRGTYTAKQLRYERWSHYFCSHIACNSPHLQTQLLEDAHVPRHKISVIPNGVDIDHFAHTPDVNFRQKIAPDAQRILLWMGRISPEKMPDLLLEAIGQLKASQRLLAGTRVLLIGEAGESATQAKIDAIIRQYQLEDLVIQASATTTPEKYYHAADVTVLVSLFEGMPNVALESLAAGRPVIISEQANAAQVITHGQTGWVVKTGNVEDLAATLAEVLAMDNDTLVAMQAACRQRAQDFSMEAMVSRYTALYHRLIQT